MDNLATTNPPTLPPQPESFSTPGLAVPPVENQVTVGPQRVSLSLPTAWLKPIGAALLVLAMGGGGWTLDSKLDVIVTKQAAQDEKWDERFEGQRESLKEFKSDIKEITLAVAAQGSKIQALQTWQGMVEKYDRGFQAWQREGKQPPK